MRIKENAQGSLQTNVVTESQEFEIGDPGMILNIVRSKIYSKPKQTLVQEYLSNARDAHREAGTAERVRVTVPTSEEPTLKVRDFGPGMSPERVAQVFVKFGKSTKRSSDTQVGGFGIGAKSAFAYTDSFTVISYHGGKAYHYVAHLSKSKAGSLDLISTVDTAEPSGIEVQIAVKDGDVEDFVNAILRATALWTEAEYPTIEPEHEIDGTPVAPVLSFPNVGIFQIDRLPTGGRENRYGNATPVLCVDGIPYPLPSEYADGVEELTELLTEKYVSVLYFKTGEIEIAASREAIALSDENSKVIFRAAEAAYKTIRDHVSKDVKRQTSLRSMLETHRTHSRIVHHREDFVFRADGEEFKIGTAGIVEFPERFNFVTFKSYDVSSGSERLRVNDTRSVKYPLAHKTYWSDDVTSTANQNRRFKAKLTNGSTARKELYLLCAADVTKPELRELAELLGLPGTSTLGPSFVRNTVSRKSEDDVIVNVYANPTAKKTTSKVVNLTKNATPYVYAIRKTEDADLTNGEFKPLAELVTLAGLQFCLVSETTVKRLDGNAKFTSVADFFHGFDTVIAKSKAVEQAVMNCFVNEIYSNTQVPTELIPLALQIKDATLRAGLVALAGVKELKTSRYGRTNNIPEVRGFRKQMTKHAPKLAEFFDAVQALHDRMKKGYPLAHDFLDGYVRNKPTLAEVVFYLNAKLPTLGDL